MQAVTCDAPDCPRHYIGLHCAALMGRGRGLHAAAADAASSRLWDCGV
jgi:hypothetical protein